MADERPARIGPLNRLHNLFRVLQLGVDEIGNGMRGQDGCRTSTAFRKSVQPLQNGRRQFDGDTMLVRHGEPES